MNVIKLRRHLARLIAQTEFDFHRTVLSKIIILPHTCNAHYHLAICVNRKERTNCVLMMINYLRVQIRLSTLLKRCVKGWNAWIKKITPKHSIISTTFYYSYKTVVTNCCLQLPTPMFKEWEGRLGFFLLWVDKLFFIFGCDVQHPSCKRIPDQNILGAKYPSLRTAYCSVFPLAFAARSLQGHWWGFISRNYVVWPTFLLMNVFIALKGSHFRFLLK